MQRLGGPGPARQGLTLRGPARRGRAWRWPSALGLVLLASACTTAEGSRRPGDPGAAMDVRAAVNQAWAGHLAAAEAKHLDGVMALYADDVVFANLGDAEVRGHAALADIEAAGLASHDVSGVTHTLLALHVDGDTAEELGLIRGPVSERGGATRDVTWRFLAHWRRGPDGRWRITRIVGAYQ